MCNNNLSGCLTGLTTQHLGLGNTFRPPCELSRTIYPRLDKEKKKKKKGKKGLGCLGLSPRERERDEKENKRGGSISSNFLDLTYQTLSQSFDLFTSIFFSVDLNRLAGIVLTLAP
jgi:hypothetical protein